MGVLAGGRDLDRPLPVVVKMSQFVGELLMDVHLPTRRVPDHIVVRRRNRALVNF